MATDIKQNHIPSAPTDASIFYPEEDGEPMAVSDLHRWILMRILQVLEAYFEDRPGVYVSGDILMYYVEGDPRKSVSPDVLVAFGLGKKRRGNYKVWEEGKVPDFVMEFSSKSTYRNDLGRKMELYASLGIQNYFLYDAEGLYLPSPLLGFTLVEGAYVPISPGADGGLHAAALGLDFHVSDEGLGLYDSVASEWLQTPAESATVRAETAEARIETAEARAETAEARVAKEAIARQQEAARAETAEAEATRLREELARLQAQNH